MKLVMKLMGDKIKRWFKRHFEIRKNYLGLFVISQWNRRQRHGISLNRIWPSSERWFIWMDCHLLRPNELLEIGFGVARFCVFWPKF